MKSGGYLVIATDVLSHLDQSYHGQGEFIKVKDMIDIYESKGFKLIGDFDYGSLNDEYVIDLEYHGISRFNLTYSNIIFKK